MDDRGQKLKTTQGHKKLKQYTEDLVRNKTFLKKLLQIKKRLENENWDDDRLDDEYSPKLRNLFMQYESMLEDLKELQQEWPTMKMLRDLAEEYGIDCGIVVEMLAGLANKRQAGLLENFDFCDIIDNYEEYVDQEIPGVPVELDYYKHSHAYAYPVRLDIHKFASRNDVLDFVKKRWDVIQKTLGDNKPAKVPRFRERKQPRQVTDFIWEHYNQGKSLKEIKKSLDEKIPKTGLVDYEIGKLISLEKQRRLKEINGPR